MLDNTSLDNSVSEYSSCESVTCRSQCLTSPLRLKQIYKNFAKYELLWLYNCMTIWLSILILKLCIHRCDGPERHEMLTIINNYYGYTKCFKFGMFCTNPD